MSEKIEKIDVNEEGTVAGDIAGNVGGIDLQGCKCDKESISDCDCKKESKKDGPFKMLIKRMHNKS